MKYVLPSLKKSLEKDTPTLMMNIKQVGLPEMGLLAASCGFDAVYVDLEHALVSEREAAQICIVSAQQGLVPLIRIPAGAYSSIGRLLDGGAMGIIVPHVEDAGVLDKAARHCYFSPMGERSFPGAWPQFCYDKTDPIEAAETLNASTAVIGMIESRAGLDNIEEIASVPGLTALHIGTNDLCQDIGIMGQLDHPQVLEIYEQVVAIGKKHGLAVGAGGLSGHPEFMERLLGRGVQLVTVGNEWGFLAFAARNRVAELRKLSTKTKV